MKAIVLLNARNVVLTHEAVEKLEEVCSLLHGEVTETDKRWQLDDIITSNLDSLLRTLKKEAV